VIIATLLPMLPTSRLYRSTTSDKIQALNTQIVNLAAQYNLGLSYANGDGVAQDYERAAQWYEKAAERTHIQAQYNLGLLYLQGKGVAKDPLRAYFWVKVAALQGDDRAQDSLNKVAAGMSAEQVRQAEAQADEWMKRAKKLLK